MKAWVKACVFYMLCFVSLCSEISWVLPILAETDMLLCYSCHDESVLDKLLSWPVAEISLYVHTVCACAFILSTLSIVYNVYICLRRCFFCKYFLLSVWEKMHSKDSAWIQSRAECFACSLVIVGSNLPSPQEKTGGYWAFIKVFSVLIFAHACCRLFLSSWCVFECGPPKALRSLQSLVLFIWLIWQWFPLGSCRCDTHYQCSSKQQQCIV